MLHLRRKKARIKKNVALLLLSASLLINAVATAQIDKIEMNMPDHDDKPYYFGMTLGINLARFQTYLHPKFLESDSVYVAEPINSGGFTLGLSATARLSDRFQLRFEYRGVSPLLTYLGLPCPRILPPQATRCPRSSWMGNMRRLRKES